MATVQRVEVKALCELMKQNPDLDLLDVRTPGEYQSVHACGAKLLPLDRLDAGAFLASRKSAGPLYIICKGGTRSAKACEAFLSAGFGNVFSVEGGTEAWVAAGLPTETAGRRVLPLDRQVQMTAGLMCLSGALLGALVNPYFYFLSGLVGFGLTIAGLTGFCPMATLMARMPWNQGTCSGATCCSR